MKNRIKVLFIDDDMFLGQVIQNALNTMEYEVFFQSSLAGVKASIQEIHPNIIFLDVEIGTQDGIAVAPQLKALVPNIPILFVSSHTDGETISRGLDTGVEGYLKKPFEIGELIAYIKKYATEHLNFCIKIGKLSLDTATYALINENQIIKYLSNMEYKLLKYLAAYPNQVVKRKDIENELWKDEELSNEKSLNNFISKLRKYLSDYDQLEIIMIPKQGYKLVIKHE